MALCLRRCVRLRLQIPHHLAQRSPACEEHALHKWPSRSCLQKHTMQLGVRTRCLVAALLGCMVRVSSFVGVVGYACWQERGWAPLHIACENGHLTTLAGSVQRGGRVDLPKEPQVRVRASQRSQLHDARRVEARCAHSARSFQGLTSHPTSPTYPVQQPAAATHPALIDVNT